MSLDTTKILTGVNYKNAQGEISSYTLGGGSSISSLNDIANKLLELNTEAQNYFSSIINTYVPKFNTPVTLYTPNAECKNYFIRKRQGVYNVIWTNLFNFSANLAVPSPLLYGNMSTVTPYITYTNSRYGIPVGKPSKDIGVNVLPNAGSGEIALSYKSQDFSSLEDAVAGIQSNSTTYTSITSPYTIEPVDNKYVFYTNTLCNFKSNAPTIDTTFETNLDIISKNETIEVIA